MSQKPREVPVDRTELNHANLSRADMARKVIPGPLQTVRDMTGRPMTIKTVSNASMAAATYSPEELEVGPPPERLDTREEPPPSGVTYTYGVPENLARHGAQAEQDQTLAPADRSAS